MVLSLLFRFKSMSASAEMFVDDETISSNISVPVVEERYRQYFFCSCHFSVDRIVKLLATVAQHPLYRAGQKSGP